MTLNNTTRRSFLSTSASFAAAAFAAPLAKAATTNAAPNFKISLAQWSLHKMLQGKKMDNLDFAETAKNEFGIEGIEYVNQFFKDKAQDKAYLAEMNKRAADNGVTQLLIMIDGEGQLGAASLVQRAKAVENHYKWVEAATTRVAQAVVKTRSKERPMDCELFLNSALSMTST